MNCRINSELHQSWSELHIAKTASLYKPWLNGRLRNTCTLAGKIIKEQSEHKADRVDRWIEVFGLTKRCPLTNLCSAGGWIELILGLKLRVEKRCEMPPKLCRSKLIVAKTGGLYKPWFRGRLRNTCALAENTVKGLSQNEPTLLTGWTDGSRY